MSIASAKVKRLLRTKAMRNATFRLALAAEKSFKMATFVDVLLIKCFFICES